MRAPHRSNSASVTSTSYVQVLGLGRCEFGRDFVLSVRGQNIGWRVICNGFTGRETVQSGSIPAGSEQKVRVHGLPSGPWGGAELLLEAALLTGSTAVEVRGEATWTPQYPADPDAVPRSIGERS